MQVKNKVTGQVGEYLGCNTEDNTYLVNVDGNILSWDTNIVEVVQAVSVIVKFVNWIISLFKK